MITIAGHTFDEGLLPKNATILDLGCRGFEFTDYFSPNHFVIPIDADLLDEPDRYFRCAIDGYNGRAGVKRADDKQATKIVIGDEIECYTIQEFSRINDIGWFDLIKLDIEGSEYGAIMALDKPIATQLSIEFHLHTGAYGQYEMTLMEDKLKALGYVAVQHELTEEHCAGFNYWNSLFILK